MEVYILDSLYRRSTVVDDFQSLIWTERRAAWGDFELDLHSTLENRNRFVTGLRLAIPESYRVMTVETIEDTTNDEGERILKVRGRSLEAILEQRLAMAALTDLTTNPKWEITDLPKVIATKLFHDICVTGILNSGDIIAGVTEANIFPPDTIAAPSDTITYSIDPEPLYTAIKDLCDAYAMGFRLIRDPNTSMLYFDVYMGSNRTTSQTSLDAVVFSPDLDNLRNTNKLVSSALYRNVAYVVSPVGHQVVYATDVDPTTAGFDRKVLFVKADDITDANPTVAAAKMVQKGQEELAKNRQITMLDGELAPTSQYVYGLHYNLGDLVELRDDDGASSEMQVAEQIFVSDNQGDRAYPTLQISQFITPGSWLDRNPDEHWADVSPTEHWGDL